MRHDQGLDASPPVCCILEVERSGYSSFQLPSAVDGQPPLKAAACSVRRYADTSKHLGPSFETNHIAETINMLSSTYTSRQAIDVRLKLSSKPGQTATEQASTSRYPAYLCGMMKGDRRDSNPRPSEPQSAVTRFCRLPTVAKTGYLSRFLCWRLPPVSACCALSGVNSGVKWHQPLPVFRGVSAHPGPRQGHPEAR